jgi:hypothetical protein
MTTVINKTDVSHDFDFFFHRWIVHNHKLTRRLQGSNEWIDFDATQRCVPALGGLGNTDQLIAEDGTPIGMSLRFFDREKQQWSIYWVSFSDGLMQPPVHGTFTNGVGIFEGDDVWEGTPVRVRFVWSDIHTPMPKWEQYFSPDNGKTWEKNWVMTFELLED